MKLRPIASNMTELEIADGTIILFSYETPVAACMGDGIGFVRTNEHYSPTTTRHINKWLNGTKALPVPQRFIDNLIN